MPQPPVAQPPERREPGRLPGPQTVAILVFLISTALFAVIAWNVVAGGRLTAQDESIVRWFQVHTPRWSIRAMGYVTYLGDPFWIAGLTGVTALLLAERRQWFRFASLILTVPCGQFVNAGLKLLFHRDRPALADVAELLSYSFPSGHTVAATLFYGFWACLAVQLLHAWPLRALAILLASLLVALVALSRICLGVHYPSDVLAGILVGTAWLSLCEWVIVRLQDSRYETRKTE